MAIGKLFILAGITLLFIGLVISYAPWLVSWFGKLPGDIRIQGEKRFVFFPFTSMLVVSIVLTLIINLFLRR